MEAVPAFVRLAAHPVRWRLLTELAGSDHRVRELVEQVGEPQNLVSYHLRLLRSGGLVTARRSSHDGRDTYYHLDLARCAQALATAGTDLHPALRLGPVPDSAPSPDDAPRLGPEPTAAPGRRRVLFTCTGNSARSPIAAALLRHRSAGRVEVASAGSHPKPEIHPAAVRALRDRYGLDIAGHRPRCLDTLTGRRFDYVITLCDKVREVCPEFPGRPRRLHWSLPDPATTDATFDGTAAEIDARIHYLLPVLQEEVSP